MTLQEAQQRAAARNLNIWASGGNANILGGRESALDAEATTLLRKEASRSMALQQIINETGVDAATASRLYDQYGGDMAGAKAAANKIVTDAATAKKKAEDEAILANARTANLSNLDYQLAALNKRKDALGGDYAKTKFQTDLDIERAKAEAQGGRYGVDTDGNGRIDENEYVTVDPRMSTAGRTQTQMVRSDNARGLLNTTLSQGASANYSDALQRQLMQFTGGKQTELANTKKAQDTELADLEGSLNASKLAYEKEGNEAYEIDPVTGKYKKKVTA